MHLLIVEDDPETANYVRLGLAEYDYVVDVANTGSTGLEMALTGDHDLIILDVRLPEIDGFEILKRMRGAGVETPVLFLSAQGDVHSRIEGLNLGADDFVPKPFALAELVARIRSVERRRHPESQGDAPQVADLRIDRDARSVHRGEQRIDLTQKEFQLLSYLVRIRGQVATRSMITENVWGHGFDSFSNLVDVHITRLRRKVDRDFEPKLVHTVKGAGYILEDRS